MAAVKVNAMEITAQQFIDLGRHRSLEPLPRIGFAALLAIAIAVTVAQPGKVIGLLVLVVAMIGCGVVWWTFFRRQGERLNNYDPLKTDVEVQRTATDWKEELRMLFLVVVGFMLVNIGGVWSGMLAALIVGLIGFAVFYFLLGRKPSRPKFYTLPEDLVAERESNGIFAVDSVLTKGQDGLIAALYALLLVPGGIQMQKTVLVSKLTEELRVSEADVNAALNKAKASGDVVTLRELRTRDEAREWVTLTPKSSHAFQERIKAGK